MTQPAPPMDRRPAAGTPLRLRPFDPRHDAAETMARRARLGCGPASAGFGRVPRIGTAMPARPPERGITVRAVIAEVAAHYGWSIDELFGDDDRYGGIALARHMVCFLARRSCAVPKAEVARRFGNRHPSTVDYGVARVAARLAVGDPGLMADVRALQARLQRLRESAP